MQTDLWNVYYEISTRMGQPTTHIADGFEEGGWVGDGQDAEEDETQLLHLIPAHHPLQAANLHHHAQNYLKLVSIKKTWKKATISIWLAKNIELIQDQWEKRTSRKKRKLLHEKAYVSEEQRASMCLKLKSKACLCV